MFENIELPKWPQMLVTGKSVSIEHAKEIIFRTDNFIYSGEGGNDYEFATRYRKFTGLNQFEEYTIEKFRIVEKIKKQNNFISTDYVHNDWAASCFINGPHGWCSPNGEISFIDNVGKWPSVNGILADWQLIAKEFNFLNLTATLMNAEECEENAIPLVNIEVFNGLATLKNPDITIHENITDRYLDRKCRLEFYDSTHKSERGLPGNWYIEYAKRIKSTLNEILYAD